MVERQEGGKGEKQSGLERLLSEAGALSAETPLGREPVTYTMESLDRLRSKPGTRSDEASKTSFATSRELEAQRRSVERIAMAYQIIAYPLLEVADERFENDPHRDPTALPPRAWQAGMNELITNAIEHPGENTEEYPHRAPVTLSPAERAALGKIAVSRGLPFNSQKAEYNYLELAPARQARIDETDRRFGWIGIDNAVNAGIYRSRHEIDEEIRKRLEGSQAKRRRPPRTNK